ncbi:MAG TPA: alpha/beta hydrolase [Candidatus Gracilibacteria bacterium]
MLHGWGGSAESFSPLIQELKNLDKSLSPQVLKFFMPTFPGFGDSPAPEKPWDTKDYADWLDTELKKNKINPFTQEVVFYGHSFGCRVIVRWLMAHPDFKGKIILTGAAGIKWPLSFKQRCIQHLANFSRKFRKPAHKKRSKPSLQETKSFWGKCYRKMARIFGFGDWSESDIALKPTLQKVLAEEDLRIYLPHITNQVLLIWGAKDTYTPLKSAQVFHSSLPHNELVVIPDGKHGIHYTHKAMIAKLVGDFVTHTVSDPF